MVVVLVATLNTAFFTFAATFSGNLVGAGTTVLSRSPLCGMWNQTYLNMAAQGSNSVNFSKLALQLSTEYMDKLNEDIQLSETYANQCYFEVNNNSVDSCAEFRTPRLSWTTDINTSCPFQGDVCHIDIETVRVSARSAAVETTALLLHASFLATETTRHQSMDSVANLVHS